MKHSIRRRLLLVLLIGVLGQSILSSYWTYKLAVHEVEEVYDGNLVQTAKALLTMTSTIGLAEQQDFVEVNSKPSSVLLTQYHKYEFKLAYQIDLLTTKNRSLHSDSMPSLPQIEYSIGFRDEYLDTIQWRFFTLKDEQSGIQIQTAERHDVRNEMIYELLKSAFAPLIISLLVLPLLIWLSVGNSLRPLHRLSKEISMRELSQLQAVALPSVPTEILPLINALNQLFIRLEHAFNNERRFTADAAHELRTPLAGVQLQAEVALNSTEESTRQQALRQIVCASNRATRLVEQLLSLARIDSQTHLKMEVVNLSVLLADIIKEIWYSATQVKLDFSLEKSDKAPIVQANPDTLYLLLRNLLSNALTYVPPTGDKVEIYFTHEKNALILHIEDNGPGIPSAERQHIFERFTRGQKSIGTGSGLGLSIVARIAELHQITIQLDHAKKSDQGLLISLRFPF